MLMLYVTEVINFIFWLVAVPFCIGMIPASFIPPARRSLGFTLLAGYFSMWALFEISAVPAVLWVKYDNFKAASTAFMMLSLLAAGAGILLLYRNGRPGGPGLIRLSPVEWMEWLLFFALLGFQMYKAVAYASFDGDDAYYVVESLIAQESDVMYRILPYTGRPTDLDVRHALAVFPMWVAFVSVRAGVHATIVSHVVMPLVLIPLTYLLYFEIGRLLFDNRESLAGFMVIMGMFQIFGNVSIYTNETFFLTRTWQGKAVAGSLVIPALIWVFLMLYGKENRENDRNDGEKRANGGIWLLFVFVHMTAGVCSSIAVFLSCILTALTAFFLALTKRDIRILLKMGAACIPSVIYMGIYVVVAYSYLL